jgi:hypothetical protein
MTDDDRAELEKEGIVPPQALSHEPHVHPPGPSTTSDDTCKRHSVLSSSTTSNGGKSPLGKEGKEKEKKRNKLTPEQRKKLQEIEEERRRSMEERVKTLTVKLIERLRPFVDAQAPGDGNDPETVKFQAKIKIEADDLKIESFGVEVRTAGGIMMLNHLSGGSIVATCDRDSIYDEGDIIHEVEEVLGNVSGAVVCFILAAYLAQCRLLVTNEGEGLSGKRRVGCYRKRVRPLSTPSFSRIYSISTIDSVCSL